MNNIFEMNGLAFVEFEEQVENWCLKESEPPTLAAINAVSRSDEPLSCKHCELLELPVGTSYGNAAGELIKRLTRVVDLHGCTVRRAIEVADESLRIAAESGDAFVKLIHGAPDIFSWQQAQIEKRGGIKWAIRNLLLQGKWEDLIHPKDSEMHKFGDGAVILALRVQDRKAACRQ